jgi:hypothetical protein
VIISHATTPLRKSQIKAESPRQQAAKSCLLGLRGVLGDGLGALRDGVLGQLTGEDESDGGLDLSGRDSRLLVVGSKLGSLSGNALEDVWFEVRMIVFRDGRRRDLPFTKELRMDMARLEIPVSGWTCLRTERRVRLMVNCD